MVQKPEAWLFLNNIILIRHRFRNKRYSKTETRYYREAKLAVFTMINTIYTRINPNNFIIIPIYL
jgi:hypothetical protein